MKLNLKKSPLFASLALSGLLPHLSAQQVATRLDPVIVTGSAEVPEPPDELDATERAAERVARTPGGASLVTPEDWTGRTLTTEQIFEFAPGVSARSRGLGSDARIAVQARERNGSSATEESRYSSMASLSMMLMAASSSAVSILSRLSMSRSIAERMASSKVVASWAGSSTSYKRMGAIRRVFSCRESMGPSIPFVLLSNMATRMTSGIGSLLTPLSRPAASATERMLPLIS